MGVPTTMWDKDGPQVNMSTEGQASSLSLAATLPCTAQVYVAPYGIALQKQAAGTELEARLSWAMTGWGNFKPFLLSEIG